MTSDLHRRHRPLLLVMDWLRQEEGEMTGCGLPTSCLDLPRPEDRLDLRALRKRASAGTTSSTTPFEQQGKTVEELTRSAIRPVGGSPEDGEQIDR